MREWIQKATKLKGSFAEIGLGLGLTTVELLRTGKTVYGVDPFEEGWNEMPKSYGMPYRYEQFEEAIEPYKDNFKLHKNTSLCSSAEDFLKIPLALAYVDGLQYKGAVLNDLRIVSHAKIIIVDDYNRESGISEVPKGIEEYLKHNKRKLIIEDRWAILIK